MNSKTVFQKLAAVFLILTINFSSGLFAQTDSKNRTVFKMNALLISLEDYVGCKLDFAKNDLDKLNEVLSYNFGCTTKLIHNRSITFSADPKPDQYKREIEDEIIEWCNRLKSEDIAILYLAGHGISDPSGKLYFPMINFKNSNVQKPFEEAAIPISWIREKFETADCRCRLVLIDTCFSGISKNLSVEADVSKLTSEFNQSDSPNQNVATLASSRENQKSWLWEKEKHSLFTYWLIDALNDNADQDKNGSIDINELYNYINDNVSRISQDNSEMQPQNPVLLNEEAIIHDFILPCPAQKTSEVFQKFYRKINERLCQLGVKKILVTPEFTTGLNDEIDVSQYGALPKLFANELRTKLSLDDGNSGKTYMVFQEAQTRKILDEYKLSTVNLGTDDALDLHTGKYKVDAVLDGKISMLSEGILSITVTLHHFETEKTMMYSAKVILTPEEIAASGVSFQLKRKPPKDDPDYVISDVGVVNSEILDQIKETTNQTTHPMLDKKLPFSLEIRHRTATSGGEYKKCDGKVVDGNYYVAVDKGDEYAICLTNNDPKEELYFAKVLVDGLNTVSQKMPIISDNLNADSQDLYVKTSMEGTMFFAPRVRLEDARAWVVFNPKNGKNQNVLNIYGFCDENGANSKGYRFQVGDADESIAARQNYTEKLGIITVALYYGIPKGSRGRNGTLLGENYDLTISTYKGNVVPGDLRVVYTIRYVTREEYDKL